MILIIISIFSFVFCVTYIFLALIFKDKINMNIRLDRLKSYSFSNKSNYDEELQKSFLDRILNLFKLVIKYYSASYTYKEKRYFGKEITIGW